MAFNSSTSPKPSEIQGLRGTPWCDTDNGGTHPNRLTTDGILVG
jgi:hypothetical protein